MRTRSLAIGLMLLACVSCGRGRSHSSFADVVASATDIDIGHKADRDYPGGIGIKPFHLKRDRAVFSALSSAKPGHPPSAPAHFHVTVWEGSRAYHVYDYEDTTGSIHYGKEWLQVPEDLRQRFQKLIADFLKAHPPNRAGRH